MHEEGIPLWAEKRVFVAAVNTKENLWSEPFGVGWFAQEAVSA